MIHIQVSIFQNQAKEIIGGLNDRNILPILSGGTGLYVQSLLKTITLMTLSLMKIYD